MDRRDFVGSLLAGGAAVALGGREASGARVEPPDKAAAWRALSEHRLAKIEARRLRDRYPRRVGRNSKGRPVGGGGAYQVRTITTDQGVSGWAMSWVPDDRLGDIIGRPISELFDIEQGTLPPGDGLDLPLHDLAGNILGKPVYALLGSRGPTLVPVYSGAIYFDDMEPEDNPRGVAGVLASCQQDYDAGYRAFKLKIGRGFKWMPGEEGWQRDIDVTRAVRERFPDCKILVDANDAYTCDQFLKYLRAVADCDLFFIEEPFQENRDDLLRLRDEMRRLDCKAVIAEGEGRKGNRQPPGPYGGYTQEHMDHLYALAAEKLVDVFLLDLGIVGFTRYRNIMPEIADAGVLTAPHTWMWTPRPYYTAHLAAGVGNVLIVEGIPGKPPEADYSAFQFVDGSFALPETPGFGLKLTA